MSSGGPLQVDFQRYRYGDSKPVLSPAPLSATVIRVGSLALVDSPTNKVRPFSSIVDIGGAGPATLAAAQELAHDNFLGVSSQRSLAGEVEPLRMNTKGVHEFKATSAIYKVGQLVGPAANGSIPGAPLSDDTLVGVATPNLAVGRVVRDEPVATTTILVEITGTLTEQGPLAPA